MKLALQLPWEGATASIAPGYTPTPAFARTTDLGTIISTFGVVALYVGGFMMFFWAVWGIFDYLIAEGNKEALAKARKKIQWAIVGFIILLIAFFISDFLKDFLLNVNGQPIMRQRLENLKDPTKP